MTASISNQSLFPFLFFFWTITWIIIEDEEWCAWVHTRLAYQSSTTQLLEWTRKWRIDFFTLFNAQRKLWSGIMWFSKWNYEIVKSFFFGSIIDRLVGKKKETRSFAFINNSMNEQILRRLFIHLNRCFRNRSGRSEKNEHSWTNGLSNSFIHMWQINIM
jgi:hypothetical protein